MGYESGTKGYRFIDSNNRFIVSRTAVFHEQTNWSRIHLNEVCPHKEQHLTENAENSNRTQGKQEGAIPRPERQEIEIKDRKGNQPNIKIEKLTQKEARYLHDSESIPTRPIRSTRNQAPKRFGDFIMSINSAPLTPNNYGEVLKLPPEERNRWEEAMEREMESLRELEVFTPTKVPQGKTTIGTKWVFKIKTLEGGDTLYKARLVAQGFAQKYPDDYTETYSPTVRSESVKSALVIAAILGLGVYQFDVQTAYLHAELDKDIYVKAPPNKNSVSGETWLLNKSLYGLKQSGKRWYECLTKVLHTIGFSETDADNCFFTRKQGEDIEYILIYVDDILYIGKHKEKCDAFASDLNKHFSLKSLGEINRYLGVQIARTERGFKLTQQEKILELMHKCNMADAKPSETPMQPDFLKNMHNEAEAFTDNTLYRSTIGSLLYIANWTRPDIALPVNLLSRHVSKPTTLHWEAVKRIIRYLKYSLEKYLYLEPEKSSGPILSCYADADWAGDTKSRKSTSGYIFYINGSPVHWYTGKQNLVATSTTEAEYICLSKAANNLTWFDDLLTSIWGRPAYPIIMHEDNKAAIEISMAEAVGQRSRHIDIKHKHVRQLSKTGFIKAVHCDTEEQTADILTKPLQNKQHNHLLSKLCIKP